ncbi:MAG TPA: hypothetical protein VFM18_15045 [Methanosarcina sp.]|nr:hypothetical protein [Methanosarcina sp.]
MNYSIGQTVKIIKKVDSETGERWIDMMDSTIGMIGTIVEIMSIDGEFFYQVEFKHDSGWWYHGDSLDIEPAIEANPVNFEYLVVFKEKFENSARVSHSYYSTTEEFVTFWGDELEWAELVQSSKRIKE